MCVFSTTAPPPNLPSSHITNASVHVRAFNAENYILFLMESLGTSLRYCLDQYITITISTYTSTHTLHTFSNWIFMYHFAATVSCTQYELWATSPMCVCEDVKCWVRACNKCRPLKSYLRWNFKIQAKLNFKLKFFIRSFTAYGMTNQPDRLNAFCRTALHRELNAKQIRMQVHLL